MSFERLHFGMITAISDRTGTADRAIVFQTLCTDHTVMVTPKGRSRFIREMYKAEVDATIAKRERKLARLSTRELDAPLALGPEIPNIGRFDEGLNHGWTLATTTRSAPFVLSGGTATTIRWRSDDIQGHNLRQIPNSLDLGTNPRVKPMRNLVGCAQIKANK